MNVTGEFNTLRYDNISQIESTSNIKYIVNGVIAGNNQISYTLSTRGESTTILNQNLLFQKDNLRKASHTISNNIYNKLTGTRGVFTTKIAYAVKVDNKYAIIISDYDGYNQRTILRSNNPVSSLSWNNNNQQIAYVSFEASTDLNMTKPIVYVQDIFKASRYQVAAFSGSNSSPSFLPNNTQLIVTLSKDDGSHLDTINNDHYTKHSYAGALFPNTFGTIDTEAAVANNGKLVFTSNHDGGPQIFMSNLQGADPTRITLGLGNYNTSAKFSHDGNKITFINRSNGILKTYVMDLTTKATYPVNINTSLDLAPSFAPNDKLILFSSNHNGMYIVNATGTTQTHLNKIQADEIIDQAWANSY
jgi:TolB protein